MNLYHYCSNEAFHSIISNKKIRLSSLSLSNDSMEGKILEKELLKIAEEDGLTNDQIEGLKSSISSLTSKIDGLGFCLSEEKDLLSQWRGYACDGHGVSIGFSKKYLELRSEFTKNDPAALRITLGHVLYGDFAFGLKPVYKEIKEHIDKGAYSKPRFGSLIAPKTEEEVKKEQEEILEKHTAIFKILISISGALYYLKSNAFKEEFEWRLISLFYNIPDMDPEPCLFQPSLNKIKPYRPCELIDLKLNPIEEIVLGPKNSTPVHVIESFLKQNNFINVKVSKSKASYI